MIGFVPWPAGHIVPAGKLTGYLLDPHHPKEAAKCRFLTGFVPDDPASLEAALLAHASAENLLDLQVSSSALRYRYQGPWLAPDGRAPGSRTIWQIRPATALLHFVTLKPVR